MIWMTLVCRGGVADHGFFPERHLKRVQAVALMTKAGFDAHSYLRRGRTGIPSQRALVIVWVIVNHIRDGEPEVICDPYRLRVVEVPAIAASG
jgi:hypothetical protein